MYRMLLVCVLCAGVAACGSPSQYARDPEAANYAYRLETAGIDLDYARKMLLIDQQAYDKKPTAQLKADVTQDTARLNDAQAAYDRLSRQ